MDPGGGARGDNAAARRAGADARAGERAKKIVGHPLRSARERFAQVEAIKGEHPVEGLCELLQVSPGGYYRWRRARPSGRATQDAALSEHIVRFHARSRRTYSSPRIFQDLQEQKLRISRRRCALLMRERGLQGRKRHRRRPCTTDSRHGHAPAPNQLLQRAKPAGPDQVLVTEITYVPKEEGFL